MTLLLLTFMVAVGGIVVGLLVDWPKGGRGWSWKQARFLIASVVLLVTIVALFFYVASTRNFGE